MRIKKFDKDETAYFWWIELWKKSGLEIILNTNCVCIGVFLDITWNKEYKWISLSLFNLNINFYPEPDWY